MSPALAIRLALAVSVAGCAGVIDEGGETPDGGDGSTEPTMVDIEGPAVQPNVQHFANTVCGVTGACTITTYSGHRPSAARAIDILASDVYGKVPTDSNALGDRVAAFALAHQPEHGVMYVIWRQRYNDGSGWDAMEDRGSITQNHYDHVHVSFDAQ